MVEPIVTRRFDNLNAHQLDEYVASGGYQGLRAALAKTPTQVHESTMQKLIRPTGAPK